MGEALGHLIVKFFGNLGGEREAERLRASRACRRIAAIRKTAP